MKLLLYGYLNERTFVDGNSLICCYLKGFKGLSKATNIGVKRMGELENKPFYDAMKQMYNETEAEDKASELCSLWEEYLRDPK